MQLYNTLSNIERAELIQQGWQRTPDDLFLQVFKN